jgi:hypothetical protein
MTPLRTFLVAALLLLLRSGPALAWQDGEIRIIHDTTTRFVGTVRSIAPLDFESQNYEEETVIPLGFEISRAVRVHVDRWLDEPDPELKAETLTLFLDNPRTYFVRPPFIGKTWLFTLTRRIGGTACQLEVSPYEGRSGKRR